MGFLFMKLHIISLMSSFPSTLFFSFYIFLVFCPSEAKIQLPENVTVPAVIVFGDSIVDTGNNNNLATAMKCNFPPYGKDFMGGTPSGRFTNAKTPADLIAEELGIKELLPAYLNQYLQSNDLSTGVSFASGGTGFDPQTPKLVSVLSLGDQLESFKEYIVKLKGIFGEEKTTNILGNSIYVVVSGSNDLANTYFTIGIRRLEYDVPSYADLLVASASNFTQEIYKLGARRMAIFGTPPVGCLPILRTLEGGPLRLCAEKVNQAAQLVNIKLSYELHSLNNSLPQARVVYIDIYNPMLDLIKNPLNYGIDVVDKGCCGTGDVEATILCNRYSYTCPNDSKYLFWDSFHPTEKGYRILVDQILQKYVDRIL